MIKIEFTPGNRQEESIVDQFLDVLRPYYVSVSTLWVADKEMIEITLLD